MKFKATTWGLIILAVSASVLTVVITNSVLADHDAPIPNESVTYDPVPPADVLDRLYHPDRISANISTTATQDASTTTTGDHVVTPQSVGNSFNFTVGGSATAPGSFEVPKGFGHVKLRIRNYVNAPVDFTVQHNDSGKVYVDGKTISKNSETVWRSTDAGISDGLRSGRYTIQFRGGTNKVNVEIWGVAGSLPSDAK
ncbi:MULTISPECIES: hypothetical protein [unclassified Paenibacillus]|uniref:hypothetical protein n=1 Tax=unclassified Paenibacillus TaxID=185978 RepID=UPI0024BAC834|nr:MULTISPECIES: hypothetical protein [unclassified Paenibacillus]